MPHLYLEHTADRPAAIASKDLLSRLHQVVHRVLDVPISNCKARVLPLEQYFIGDGTSTQSFVHLRVSFLEGRSRDRQVALGKELLELVVHAFGNSELEPQITVSIEEIERELYFKHPPGTLSSPEQLRHRQGAHPLDAAPPSEPAGIGHRITPSLLAPDLLGTVAFYRDVLDFRLTGCHPNMESPDWVEITRDGIVIWLYGSAPERTPTEPVFSGTLYLFPKSVAALARELEGRADFEWGPQRMPYGLIEFAIRDPNGYLLAFAGTE